MKTFLRLKYFRLESICLILALSFFAGEVSLAKTLDFNKTRSSTYLRGSYGLNNVGKNAYQPGFPTAIAFPDSNGVNQNYSAEFGFGFNASRVTTRLGLQLLYPQLTSGLSGVNAAGTQLLSLNSQLYALIPKMDLEFTLKQKPEFKLYFGLGAGYAFVTLRNSVTLTTSGSNAYPSGSNYTEAGTANSIMAEGYFGFEVSIFDNVGFAMDAGYQYLPVTTINASQGSTTLLGAETTGTALTTNVGTNRSFDMSNYFAAASLRIYLY